MEVIGIGAFAVVFWTLASAVADIATALTAAGHGLAVGLLLTSVFAVSSLGADFVSGLVHCAADNFGSPQTPIFGVAFIHPFREHHRDPQGITRHDFLETNGNSAIVNVLVMMPTVLAIDFLPPWIGLVAGTFLLVFAVAIMFTNQFHKWAHMETPPALVAKLQKFGLILRPAHHAVHHSGAYDHNYCITTGWMNGPVEKFGVFVWMVRTFKKPAVQPLDKSA